MNTIHQFHRLSLGLAAILLILSSMLPGCATQGIEGTPTIVPSATTRPVVINTFKELQPLLLGIPQPDQAEAQSRVDAVWQSLIDNRRVPLILGNQVVFLYRGEVEKVNWRGSFNGWSAWC